MKITLPTAGLLPGTGDEAHAAIGTTSMAGVLSSRPSSSMTPARNSARPAALRDPASGKPRDWGARAAHIPLQMVGRNDGMPPDSAANDWMRIFKPHLDVLTANGTHLVANGAFNRGRDGHGAIVHARLDVASRAIAALTRERPELAGRSSSAGPSDSA